MKLFKISYALKGHHTKTLVIAAHKYADIKKLHVDEIKKEYGDSLAFIDVYSETYRTPLWT